MANTYTQLNVHCIFAVQGRAQVIQKDVGQRLHAYIAGILKNIECYPLAVNGWKAHVHAFFEIPPSLSVSEAMRVVKSNSSKWFREHPDGSRNFKWQAGYGAFSYARSERDRVIKYIINQEEHHRGKTFREEYLDFLNKFEVPFEDRYLFEFYD
jgi:REP element-mobilizing transposase RayT